MQTSEIEDSNKVLVKENDKVSFLYNGNSVTADVKYHNGVFIVQSPNNQPISCMLSALKNHTDSFTIIT